MQLAEDGHMASSRADGAREYRLEAKAIDWRIRNDFKVQGYAFNGKIPGPSIRAEPGEELKVVVRNSLSEPLAVHWHGLAVPNNMDGVPGITQDAIMPGEEFEYEFTVGDEPGTYWYHSHQTAIHVMKGLFGALIVDPPKGRGAVDYDAEHVLFVHSYSKFEIMMSGMMARGHGGKGMGQMEIDSSGWTDIMKGMVHMVNGKAWPETDPIRVRQGQTILIRLISADGGLELLPSVHPMHVHGHVFEVLATDGHRLPYPYKKDTVLIGPGERYDLLLRASNPGRWPLHCHIEPHMEEGMMVLIEYEGYEMTTHPATKRIIQRSPTSHQAMGHKPSSIHTKGVPTDAARKR